MRPPAALLLSTVALALVPAAASAAVSAPAPAPPPAAPVPPPAPPPPPAGSVTLSLERTHGRPPFSIVGERVVIRGRVRPFVPGQRVVVRFSFNGRRAGASAVAVRPAAPGSGQFVVGYGSARPGVVAVTATHAATPAQGAFAATQRNVRFLNADLGPGARGPAVRVLQSELAGLHYAVPFSGVFDDGTGRAVVAYRKMTSQARVAAAGARVFELLQRGAGTFHVRFARDGRHVEADLTKQVLAEIDRGGRVHRIYTMSSGKPSTPTVIGHFRVYMRDPGTNSEGMVMSDYFIGGYAIHGYADVPTFAASHGCLRIPIPDAPAVFQWLALGVVVDVFNESGGGSHRVRGNAGP
jgi:peptidoglycan hydrolase-like protein with peptidoglycan-binding domain